MILNLYIRKKTISSICLVILIFALLSNFLYISLQLANGKGFNLQSLSYAIYLTPRNIYKALTVIVLISGAIVLYRFQESREWLIMSSFGNSNRRLIANVIMIQFFFILIMAYVGETLAIDLERYVKQSATFDASRGSVFWKLNNLWFKEGDTFVHVGRVVNSRTLANIDQFKLKDNDLVKYTYAKKGVFVKPGIWELESVQSYNPKLLLEKESLSKKVWNTGLHPSVLEIAGDVEANSKSRLSLQKLFLAIWNSKNLGILSEDASSNFFQRITKPFLSLASLCCIAPLLIRSRPRGIQNSELAKLSLIIIFLVGLQQFEAPPYLSIYMMIAQSMVIIVGIFIMMTVNRIR